MKDNKPEIVSQYVDYALQRFGLVLKIDGQLRDISKVLFCGRSYNSQRKTMVLELPRICKIVQFTQRGKLHTVYPEQVSSFVREAYRCDDAMKWDLLNQFSFEGEFLKDYFLFPESYGEVDDAQLRVAVTQMLSCATSAYVPEHMKVVKQSAIDRINEECEKGIQEQPAIPSVHEKPVSTDSGLFHFLKNTAVGSESSSRRGMI